VINFIKVVGIIKKKWHLIFGVDIWPQEDYF
jgi:hypothetical protein